jgi:hypothetical protein
MLDTPITSIASLTALLAYASEHVEQGFLWPEGIIYEAVDDKARDWERWVPSRSSKLVGRFVPADSEIRKRALTA